MLCGFQPVKFPEVGQCVHKLLAHPRKRDALYQQNHCGVYRTQFKAGKLRVVRSRDNGRNREFMTCGLPQRNDFSLVLREAMASDHLDNAGVYFGTTGGAVFGTSNAGGSWKPLAEHLPPVYSVPVTYPAR